MYGPDVKKPGTFAYNCLLARRMATRGSRHAAFISRLDSAQQPAKRIREQCKDTDQPAPRW